MAQPSKQAQSAANLSPSETMGEEGSEIDKPGQGYAIMGEWTIRVGEIK
jgi:hypothetical protein